MKIITDKGMVVMRSVVGFGAKKLSNLDILILFLYKGL